MIYLDSAATTLQKPPEVARAVFTAIKTLSSPGRGAYQNAMEAAELTYLCREEAARLFHVPDPAQVIFTSNATHGLNLAIHSLVRPGMRVVISGWEHNAVTRPLHALGAEVDVASSPLFDRSAALRAFREKLPGAGAAVCTGASNVFGFCLPLREIAEACRESGVPLIVDASQCAGITALDFTALGAAFVAMPGHKSLYGPQGTGLLLCRDSGEPLLYGGTGNQSLLPEMPRELPDRLEAGTLNVCGIAGLREGLRFVRQTGESAIRCREQALIEKLAQGLSGLPGLTLYTGGPDSQLGVLSAAAEGVGCEELSERLGERGIAVRSGLQCAPLAHRSAGTLDTGTVRFSVSAFNTEEEIGQTVDAMENILKNIYKM